MEEGDSKREAVIEASGEAQGTKRRKAKRALPLPETWLPYYEEHLKKTQPAAAIVSSSLISSQDVPNNNSTTSNDVLVLCKWYIATLKTADSGHGKSEDTKCILGWLSPLKSSNMSKRLKPVYAYTKRNRPDARCRNQVMAMLLGPAYDECCRVLSDVASSSHGTATTSTTRRQAARIGVHLQEYNYKTVGLDDSSSSALSDSHDSTTVVIVYIWRATFIIAGRGSHSRQLEHISSNADNDDADAGKHGRRHGDEAVSIQPPPMGSGASFDQPSDGASSPTQPIEFLDTDAIGPVDHTPNLTDPHRQHHHDDEDAVVDHNGTSIFRQSSTNVARTTTLSSHVAPGICREPESKYGEVERVMTSPEMAHSEQEDDLDRMHASAGNVRGLDGIWILPSFYNAHPRPREHVAPRNHTEILEDGDDDDQFSLSYICSWPELSKYVMSTRVDSLDDEYETKWFMFRVVHIGMDAVAAPKHVGGGATSTAPMTVRPYLITAVDVVGGEGYLKVNPVTPPPSFSDSKARARYTPAQHRRSTFVSPSTSFVCPFSIVQHVSSEPRTDTENTACPLEIGMTYRIRLTREACRSMQQTMTKNWTPVRTHVMTFAKQQGDNTGRQQTTGTVSDWDRMKQRDEMEDNIKIMHTNPHVNACSIYQWYLTKTERKRSRRSHTSSRAAVDEKDFYHDGDDDDNVEYEWKCMQGHLSKRKLYEHVIQFLLDGRHGMGLLGTSRHSTPLFDWTGTRGKSGTEISEVPRSSMETMIQLEPFNARHMDTKLDDDSANYIVPAFDSFTAILSLKSVLLLPTDRQYPHLTIIATLVRADCLASPAATTATTVTASSHWILQLCDHHQRLIEFQIGFPFPTQTEYLGATLLKQLKRIQSLIEANEKRNELIVIHGFGISKFRGFQMHALPQTRLYTLDEGITSRFKDYEEGRSSHYGPLLEDIRHPSSMLPVMTLLTTHSKSNYELNETKRQLSYHQMVHSQVPMVARFMNLMFPVWKRSSIRSQHRWHTVETLNQRLDYVTAKRDPYETVYLFASVVHPPAHIYAVPSDISTALVSSSADVHRKPSQNASGLYRIYSREPPWYWSCDHPNCSVSVPFTSEYKEGDTLYCNNKHRCTPRPAYRFQMLLGDCTCFVPDIVHEQHDQRSVAMTGKSGTGGTAGLVPASVHRQPLLLVDAIGDASYEFTDMTHETVLFDHMRHSATSVSRASGSREEDDNEDEDSTKNGERKAEHKDEMDLKHATNFTMDGTDNVDHAKPLNVSHVLNSKTMNSYVFELVSKADIAHRKQVVANLKMGIVAPAGAPATNESTSMADSLNAGSGTSASWQIQRVWSLEAFPEMWSEWIDHQWNLAREEDQLLVSNAIRSSSAS